MASIKFPNGTRVRMKSAKWFIDQGNPIPFSRDIGNLEGCVDRAGTKTGYHFTAFGRETTEFVTIDEFDVLDDAELEDIFCGI